MQNLRPFLRRIFFFFFFNDTATTEIYTLSLHDALPISARFGRSGFRATGLEEVAADVGGHLLDRKSTRLNSSHLVISYAVFCLQKKSNDHVEELLGSTELYIYQTPNKRMKGYESLKMFVESEGCEIIFTADAPPELGNYETMRITHKKGEK